MPPGGDGRWAGRRRGATGPRVPVAPSIKTNLIKFVA